MGNPPAENMDLSPFVALVIRISNHLQPHSKVNLALWKKAVRDAWLQLAVSGTILVLFSWLFVWLMSLLKIGAWSSLLSLVPKVFQPLLDVPLADLATPTGQLSVLYVHVITMLVCIGWAVGRGSDSISGEINRGTMDLILSLPVRRATVMAVPAVVATAGAAVLAGSVWLGTWVGVMTVELQGDASLVKLSAGAINLFCLTFCLTGITTLVSSRSRDRWRTIWTTGGFYIVSLIIKMVARLWKEGQWLKYLSFLTPFQPQELILMKTSTLAVALKYNGTLVGLGLLCYLAAAIVLSRRDIPAAR